EDEHRARYFHHGEVETLSNICELLPIQIADVIIHHGIGSRGIFAQNVIKHDQRLDDDFPTGLPNVLETADLIADTIRSGGILKQTAAALRNLLEQYQLQDWDQRPQLRHLKDGDFLKSLHV